MNKNARKGGVAGPWLVVCAALAVAGLAFDFSTIREAPFWVVEQPGAAAALGAGGAVFAIVSSILARALLGRKPKGDGDADHT